MDTGAGSYEFNSICSVHPRSAPLGLHPARASSVRAAKHAAISAIAFFGDGLPARASYGPHRK